MDHKGFTFIEIIIVLAIVGILSVLAVPDLSAFTGRLRLETAVRSISTDLREMKMRSILERSNYSIHFDTADKLYDLPERRTFLPQGIRFGFGPKVLGPPGNPVKTPDTDGVTFSSNKATFSSQGTNSIGTIYIANDENITMAISISITGRIKIWRWTGEKWI